MASGLFFRALAARQTEEVFMNGIGFVPFVDKRRICCVGTKDLNGCSAVMIVSQSGAILAHIAPRGPNADANDPYAGDNHTISMMNSVIRLYRQYQNYFPTGAACVVTAIWRRRIGLESQQNIMKKMLQDNHLWPSVEHYQAVDNPYENGTAKGTIFIDGRGSGAPAVYVEDRLIAGSPPSVAAPAAHPSGTIQKPGRGEKIDQYTVVDMQARDGGCIYYLESESRDWIFKPMHLWQRANTPYGEALALSGRRILGFPPTRAAASSAPIAGSLYTTRRPVRGTKINQYTVVEVQTHIHEGQAGYKCLLESASPPRWLFKPAREWRRTTVNPYGEALILEERQYIGFL